MLRAARSLAFGLALLLLLALPATAQDDVPLAVFAKTPVVQPGDVIEVRVELGTFDAPAAEVLGVGFELTFDDDALAFVEGETGSLFSEAVAEGTGQTVGPRLDGGRVAYSVTLFQGAAPARTNVRHGAIATFRFSVAEDAPAARHLFGLQNAVRSTATVPSIPISLQAGSRVSVSSTRRARRVRVADASAPALLFPDLADFSFDVTTLRAPSVFTITRADEGVGGTALPMNGQDPYQNAATGFWEIDPDGAATYQAEVCIPLDRMTSALNDPAALRIARRADPAAPWTLLATTLKPFASPTRVCASTTAPGQFAAVAPQSALPVELVSFRAIQTGKDVDLVWETASEQNNAGFEVQHQSGARAMWAALGFVEGAGTTAEAQTYRFRVHDLPVGTHRFRLKQVDTDGAFEYSEAVEVARALSEPYRLVAPSPNPATRGAMLRLAVAQSQAVAVTVYDLLGRKVATAFDGTLPAQVERSIRVGEQVPAGSYFIRIEGERFAATERLVVVR